MLAMRLSRLLFILSVIVIAFGISWLVITAPSSVDMTQYAPADSLLYLECNDIQAVAQAIRQTTVWEQLAPLINDEPATNVWFLRLVRWTGLGRPELVIASRAQVVVVVTNISTISENETLRVRPDFALIVETHTPAVRTKPVVEQLLSRYARNAFGDAGFKSETKDNIELMIWTAPDQRRRIIASVQGTVLTISNSESAIDACQEVRRGTRASLKSSTELQSVRARLTSANALAFGYVPADKIGQLAAIAVPLVTRSDVLTSLPDDFVSRTASKLVRSVAWSASATSGQIEDRYEVALAPAVQSQLSSTLRPATLESVLLPQLAAKVDSITVYRYENLFAAWQGLEMAFISQLDALSAVMFQTFMKSVLLSYGIDDPQQFLRLLGREIYTVRASASSDQAVVIAEINSASSVDNIVKAIEQSEIPAGDLRAGQILLFKQKDLAVALHDKYLLVGKPADVDFCLQHLSRTSESAPQTDNATTISTPPLAITTSKDYRRVYEFIQAVAYLRDRADTLKDSQSEAIASRAYAVTETHLTQHGVERRTKSPVGQIGALVTLVASP